LREKKKLLYFQPNTDWLNASKTWQICIREAIASVSVVLAPFARKRLDGNEDRSHSLSWPNDI
jgi:hypothetical protein